MRTRIGNTNAKGVSFRFTTKTVNSFHLPRTLKVDERTSEQTYEMSRRFLIVEGEKNNISH